MVEDLHRNIFQPYGGRLLEDDVTKALVNVLDKCNRKKVLKPFLKGIIPKISFPDNLESIKFSMQETPADKAKKSKTKYVVGISPEINGGEKKNSVDKKMEKKVKVLTLLRGVI